MRYFSLFAVILILVLAGCRTSEPLIETGELTPADITADELMSLIPEYGDALASLSGSGRALVSQPGASDRVTLDFHSNRDASLVTVRNRLGMEGAEILVKDDSILVYNKIDNIAEKVSLRDGNLTQVGALATVNLVELFHFPASKYKINQIYQDNDYYVAITEEESRLTIDKSNGAIMDVQLANDSDDPAPYKRVTYEAYEHLKGFYLPRKITIFSFDGSSRVTFLVRQLEVNEPLPPLTIQIPENIPLRIL